MEKTNREAIEIIKAVKSALERDCPLDWQEALDMAISALEQQERCRWTRTADALPDPWEYVWVTDRRGHLATCQLSHKTGDWYDDEDEWLYDHDSIVAWMPYEVPEPYKVEESDG